MSAEGKKRFRKMSIEQRRVLEFFEMNPNATRPQCREKIGGCLKSIARKVEALIDTGYLAATSEGHIPTFSYTGKPFQRAAEYEPCQKWIAVKMRASAKNVYQDALRDTVTAAFHAMCSTGRAAA